MNRHHGSRVLAALTVSALGLGLAACGDDDVEVARGESTVDTVEPTAAADDVPAGSTAAPTTTAAPAATMVTVAEPTGTTDCEPYQKTLEVAIEAYVAMDGAYPATEADLVEAGFIREEIASHDFDPVTGDVFLAPGVTCAPPRDTTLPSETATGIETVSAETIYADFEASDTVEAVGGPECARELAEIAAAGLVFIEREGRDPESLDELAGDLDVEIELWQFDPENETLLAAPGSGCVDLDQATPPGSDDVCTADRNTMQVAVEAYLAQFGSDELPDEADLLSARFLRVESDLYDVIDGEVIAVPGAGCD